MIAAPFAVTDGVVGLYDPPAHRAEGVEGVATVGTLLTEPITATFCVTAPLLEQVTFPFAGLVD